MALHKWVVSTVDTNVAAALAEETELHPFLALMLTTRGITDADSALSFLLGDEFDDPFSFADMDAAVARIEQAIDTHEKIMVYGDYDVDGITATTLLYTYLQSRGADVDYRLPTRQDGYGLHVADIDAFHACGVSLLITVDNGITAVQEVDRANALGMDVVVTDHHRPQGDIPNAVAVVDPHREDCQSGCTDYAGVGVAYMLVCALEGDMDSVMDTYGDLVALGTLADVMPLCGTVRALVRRGLAQMNHLHRTGLRALTQIAGMADKELTASRVVFSLSPRLNAAGRVDDPLKAMQLLLEQDPATALSFAEAVQACNIRRQTVENDILEQINAHLSETPDLTADRVLVIEGEGWDTGIVGILAARITERYGKPTVILSVDGDMAKGSGRSIDGFSLFDALSATAECLHTFGGHAAAAGVSLHTENIDTFRRAINAYAAKTYPQMPVQELHIDLKMKPSAIDVEKLTLLSALEPFGTGNPAPVFGLFGMRLDNIMPIGEGKHLRMSFSKGETKLTVLKFHTPYATFPVACGAVCDLAVSLEKNVYKGVISPTIILKSMRFSDTDQDTLLAAYRDFDTIRRREWHGGNVLPDRNQMAGVYRYLAHRGGFCGTLEQLHHAMHDSTLSYLTLRVLLEVWRQAGVVSVQDSGEILEVQILPVQGKSDLTATALWQYLQ